VNATNSYINYSSSTFLIDPHLERCSDHSGSTMWRPLHTTHITCIWIKTNLNFTFVHDSNRFFVKLQTSEKFRELLFSYSNTS